MSRVLSSIALLILSACAVRAVPLRDLPIDGTKALAREAQRTTPIVIEPFLEQRGDTFERFSPTVLIPVVNLFYMGGNSFYPDLSASVIGDDGNEPVVYVGGLGDALPHLLARKLVDSKLTPNATPADDLNDKVPASRFPYRIVGSIDRSQFHWDVNIVPLCVLSVVGVPCGFSKMELDITLELVETASGRTVSRRNYAWEGKKVTGMYYNHNPVRQLLEEGLEVVLGQAVDDLAGDLNGR